LCVVAEALGHLPFPLIKPIVPRIAGGDEHLPFTGIGAVNDKVGRTPVAQRKTGSLRIDARASTIASSQPDLAVFSHIDSVETALLHRQSCLRRINFKILFVRGKLCESNRCGAFNYA
jgi:hypothetical protein